MVDRAAAAVEHGDVAVAPSHRVAVAIHPASAAGGPGSGPAAPVKRLRGNGFAGSRAAARGIHRLDCIVVRRAGRNRRVAVGCGGNQRAAVERCRVVFAAGRRAAIDVVAPDRAAGGHPSQSYLRRNDRRAQTGRRGRVRQGIGLVGGRALPEAFTALTV